MSLEAFLKIAEEKYKLISQVNRIRTTTNSKLEVDSDIGYHRLSDPEFLVAPIFEDGAVSMFYGMKGIGKTSMAMTWAYAAALGESVINVFNAPKSVGVLYLEGESGKVGMKRRLNHSREFFGLKHDQPTPFYHGSVSLDLYSEDGRAWVDRQIREINKTATGNHIQLLVIDNLTSMCGAKDYAPGWDAFFAWACKLRDQGLHVLVVGHTSKKGELLGSGMKANNVDNLIRIERYKELETEDEDGKTRKKTAQELQSEADARDPDLLQIRLEFEKLRNNPYPEAKKPINLEHRIGRNTWEVIGGTDLFIKNVMIQQIGAERTDKEMGIYWGMSESKIRSMRKKLELVKNPERGKRHDKKNSAASSCKRRNTCQS